MSRDNGSEELLLDHELPEFDARQFTAVIVDAAPERTYEAVRALDPDEVAGSFPPMKVFGQIRAMPARFSPGHRTENAEVPAQPNTLGADDYREAFVILAEQPGTEFVLGMIGKFMTAREMEFRRFEPTEFAEFREPGFGKVALNFRVQPYGAHASLLSTETRTLTTDDDARVHFRRYWRFVSPFAGMIMRRWLRLAKQNAERADWIAISGRRAAES